MKKTSIKRNIDSADDGIAIAEAGETKPRIQSAVRTVAILTAIAESPHGLKAKEIAEQLRLSRQVTYHLVHTLRTTGIIRKDEHNRYVLGLGAVAIAEGFTRQLAPPQHLDRRVRAIVAATGETAHASGWIAGEIVALASMPGESAIRASHVPVGYSGYAHARAAGKLLLSLLDPAAQSAYLARHNLVARTGYTITDLDALYRDFEFIQIHGYALDNEEFHEGLRCLAVPVEGVGGRFALTISVPAARFEANFQRYLSVLQQAARIDA